MPQAKPKHEKTYPPVMLENTQLRQIHSKITNRDYLLYIGYPWSYQTEPERKYPVVYHTDAYWSFPLFNSLGGLWYDKLAPEYIIVGIGYAGKNVDYNKERMYELSPSRQDYDWAADMTCPMGGARKFLDAIKMEIIPYVEEHTRADTSFRALAGASMGGLFSLFAMYEEPRLWQGIIAVSPVVEWDHCWLFHRESQLRAQVMGNNYDTSKYDFLPRLFMSVGGAEDAPFIGGIKAFNEIISSAGYANFEHEFRIIEGEGHASNCPESYTRGLRFIFKEEVEQQKSSQ